MRILFKCLDSKEGIMSMTPKFKIGDRVITHDNITGEVTGIHINMFDDATRTTVMYTLKNLVSLKIGQVLTITSVLRLECDLTLVPVPEPVTYEFTVRFTAEMLPNLPVSQEEAESVVRGFAVTFGEPSKRSSRMYKFEFGKPAPVKTAREVEGEYWAEYYGMGTE